MAGTIQGLHLAVSLRGQAQGGNLPAGDRENFEKLVKALSERFSPESQTELYRAQLKDNRNVVKISPNWDRES